jgi:purine-nucleoside/S-methyl-5'-thioadenosine phosphorylase / adenosine deaminase
VAANRRTLAELARIDAGSIGFGLQVHGADVREWRARPAGEPPYARRRGTEDLERVDGHATRLPRLALMVLVADCYPVALAGGGRAAMLHCGWRGVAAGLIERALAGFEDPPAAAVGPGIGACCYEVGPEVLEEFSDLPDAVSGRMLDLRAVIGHRLAAAGVGPVQHVEACTSCNQDLFFSHRRDGGVTGRQAGLVWLES